MYLVLIGPPGVGKGTQAELLSKRYNIPSLSTGEILRDAVTHKTEAGINAKDFMDKGLLVPDNIVSQIVVDKFQDPECKQGFILDGYPRNLEQAEYFQEILELHSKSTELKVIYIYAERDNLLKRISGRFACADCGQNYNEHYHPPKEPDICNTCGSANFIHRDDDRVEAVEQRLEIYRKKTEPLIRYYADKKQLIQVDGNQPIEQVNDNINALLKQ